MNMEKVSFPSSARLSLTIKSVKLMQASGPGGWMVMVVPLVKSESENFRVSYMTVVLWFCVCQTFSLGR